MYYPNDAESPMDEHGEVKGFHFNEKSIRQAFVRKVYLVLMAQLILTFGIVSFFTFDQKTGEFAKSNPNVVYGLMIASLVLILAIVCCENVRRTAPMNYVFLFIFTLVEGLLLGFFSTTITDKHLVMTAIGVTAIICLSLTLFAFQTKIDFTGCGVYLFIGLICLMLFGIILMFIPSSNYGHKIYAGLGVTLFAFYLVYDTQLMLGGSHKYSISPEEYIFAALNLYLDIINLFIYVLRLLR